MMEESMMSEAPGELVKAAPIESRFLFVDIAAARAKQLRRGALPRLTRDAVEPRDIPHKLERVAMMEVSRGLVHYATADTRTPS